MTKKIHNNQKPSNIFVLYVGDIIILILFFTIQCVNGNSITGILNLLGNKKDFHSLKNSFKFHLSLDLLWRIRPYDPMQSY